MNASTACSFPSPWLTPSRDHIQRNYSDTKTQYTSPTYVGVYANPAFGNFTVYVTNDTLPHLRYKFGRLLSGRLQPSERDDKFYMTLDEPLTYRLTYNPRYSPGFPVYFTLRTQGFDVKAVSVTVPYLEFSLPPVFTKVVPGSKMNAGQRTHSDILVFIVILVISSLL